MRSGDARRAGARTPRPGQRGAVRLGRIRGGEHQRAPAPRPRPRARAARAAARPRRPSANCAPPSPSTKYPRRQRPSVSRRAARRRPRRSRRGFPRLARRRASTIPCRSSSSSASARRSGVAGRRAASRATSGPACGDRRAALAREAARRARSALRRRVAAPGAQRRPRVVRHLARPDELPERRQRASASSPVAASRSNQNSAPARAPHGSRRGPRLRDAARRRARRAPARPRGRRAPRGRARRRPRRPRRRRRAGRAARAVARDAARQDLGLPERDRKRQALQRHERLAQRRAPVDPVPRGEEAAEGGLLGGLHLAAQRGERRTPQPAQDVRVAPLALGAAGPQLAADELLLALELDELRLDVPPEQLVRLARRERPAPARETRHEAEQRLVARLEEDLGQPSRRHHAERVAVAARVLGSRDQPLARRRAGSGTPAARARASRRSRGRTRPRTGRRGRGADREARRRSAVRA